MKVDAYLRRIRYAGSLAPTAESLKQLHRAHMLSVPFENLDIPLGIPITLSLPSLYDKIVRRGRGGFCYELNGLFGWLLEQLGFRVAMLSARVCQGAEPGLEFDHLVLLVHADERLLADVGFGDSFLDPLPLDTEQEHVQQGDSYRLMGSGPERTLQRLRDSAWEPQYVFSLTPHRLPEFRAMCRYQQTSPESVFTRKAVCSVASPNGRITLSNGRLIVTTAGQRDEREVATEGEYRALLHQHFGITLEEGARVRRLMVPSMPSRGRG